MWHWPSATEVTRKPIVATAEKAARVVGFGLKLVLLAAPLGSLVVDAAIGVGRSELGVQVPAAVR